MDEPSDTTKPDEPPKPRETLGIGFAHLDAWKNGQQSEEWKARESARRRGRRRKVKPSTSSAD